MLNLDDVLAIDIHTHAEEPCGLHADDGYDDFQAQMADYFKSPNKHPPTVQETAAYYRAKNIAAVIFPVDAERETGFRRYNNYEMLEVASDNSDVLIPFVSIDPHKGKLGVREARKLIEDYGVKGFKFHPTMQGFYPNDRMAYPLYEAINDGGANPGILLPAQPQIARDGTQPIPYGPTRRFRWKALYALCRFDYVI
jgi:predicted TIM-barrel fold metal-dependent hydrolase